MMHKHTWKLTRHNVDYIAYVFVGAGIFFAIPQVYEIYSTQNASGVSMITWVGWTFLGFFWGFYGWYRKIKPILISAFFKIGLNIMIVYGIILYG